MYARSTTIHGEKSAVEAGIAYVRDDVQPALEAMSGCVGVSMLADRASGHCIITSAWADDTSMHATEQEVVDLRRRAAEVLSGDWRTQTWEIAVLHRAHPGHDGATTRVLWGDLDPARVDDAMGTFRTALLPRMDELPGFCSLSILVDRAAGRLTVATTYDSREDLGRATDQALALREEFSAATGVTITDSVGFDLVIHHLRVPETV